MINGNVGVFPGQALDATSALIVVCGIVEVAWDIRYNVGEVSASKVTWMVFLVGTGQIIRRHTVVDVVLSLYMY